MDSISNWDTSTLTRFIKTILTDQPTQQLPNLLVDNLIIYKKLSVADQSAFTSQQVYNYIGGTATPAFTSSWSNYGLPYDGAGYIKTIDGFVRLHGAIKSGTVGSPCFTLPPGFRPSTTLSFPVVCNLATPAIGAVNIDKAGVVTPISPTNNTFVSLDGINFKCSVS